MSALQCPNCRIPLPGEFFNSPGLSNCYSCDTPLQVHAFPALFRKLEPGQSGAPVVDTTVQSACFYHPQKQASTVCAGCGRYLCALCDMEVSDRHLCPQCASSGAKKGKLKDLQNQRVLYDSLALITAVAPLLIFYFTLFTAPIALYLTIRYWNAPLSILPRSKIRFVIAGTVAALEILGWVLLFLFLYNKVNW